MIIVPIPLQSSNRRNNPRYISRRIARRTCILLRSRKPREEESRRTQARTPRTPRTRDRKHRWLAGNTARSINRSRQRRHGRTGCTPSVYRSCEIQAKEDRPVQLGCLREHRRQPVDAGMGGTTRCEATD